MAVTARADDEGGYLSGGFSSCIRKPFSMDELISAVTEVVGEKIPPGSMNGFSL